MGSKHRGDVHVGGTLESSGTRAYKSSTAFVENGSWVSLPGSQRAVSGEWGAGSQISVGRGGGGGGAHLGWERAEGRVPAGEVRDPKGTF